MEKHTTIQAIIHENELRNRRLQVPYDPIIGIGCTGERLPVAIDGVGEVLLPADMVCHMPDEVRHNVAVYRRERIKWDFEYWCATCATVRHKLTGRNVKLTLNAPQRRVLAVFERQRKAGDGIRVILLKARQWGGSTLVLMYMAWIQLVLAKNWNCLICGHKRGSAKAIKGMYSKLLQFYPKEFLEQDEVRPTFKSFEGGGSAKYITGRDCLVILGSAHSEDAVRGYDIAMAHLSEVAFWPETAMHSPEDIVRSVDGSIMMGGMSLEVMESTANGVGSFFHTEWLRAQSGRSDKVAVFVPWHEIEIYRRPVVDVAALWESMDDYERDLWNEGCTLEMINWYHHKRRAYKDHCMLMAEFPTNDLEAFANTGRCVFAINDLDRLREHCTVPLFSGDIMAVDGRLKAVGLVQNATRQLKIWRMPEPTSLVSRYVAAVDIGGRGDKADYSVITVIDRKESDDEPAEVVAQWRGHTDHDLLAWKAAQLAHFYADALLVFESNTLEMEQTEGDDGNYILNLLATHYRNLYYRAKNRPGFQTNRRTKGQIVHNLIAMTRDRAYVEHDREAVDEMSWFQLLSKGQYGAVKGKHDDMVMARAIALFVASKLSHRQKLAPGQLQLRFALPESSSPFCDIQSLV